MSKNQKGYFLIMTFFIMVILSSLAVTYTVFVNRQIRFAKKSEQLFQLEKIVLSGISFAKSKLKKNHSFRGTHKFISLKKGKFRIKIRPLKENNYEITCEAVLDNNKTTKKVICKL